VCVDDIEFDQLTAWHADNGIRSGDFLVARFIP